MNLQQITFDQINPAPYNPRKDLKPGDYVFGWDELHGPYEYPDGCEVFVVFMGEGTEHEWDAAKHSAHENQWQAETQAGKTGIERFQVDRSGPTAD